MDEVVITIFRTLNDILAAGIAITAFSLLLYALSFNLRNRVARSFALILLCVVVVYVAEALSSVSPSLEWLEFWLRLQWVGILFLPPAYMHFSDALLATTGRPSRGRRRLVVRVLYLASLVFLAALPVGWLVGSLAPDAFPAPHLQRTPLTWVFLVYYMVVMLVAVWNFRRAYTRTLIGASRRRMTYLLAGGTAPALGSFPYLLFGSGFAAQFPLLFWLTLTLSNLLVSALLVLMAYAVAFFGVPWPDRVVKRRLAKWLMRGPVTASTALAITTLVSRTGQRFEMNVSGAIPVIWVGVFLVLEHLITLLAPVWERYMLRGKDRAEIELLQTLDERLLTTGDLRQFLEAILAAVCDRLQISQAFIAALGSAPDERPVIDLLVMIGGENPESIEDISLDILQAVRQNGKPTDDPRRAVFSWGDYWLIPLYAREPDAPVLPGVMAGAAQPAAQGPTLIGLLGALRPAPQAGQVLDEQDETLEILTERAAQALSDRVRQQQAFDSLQELTPQMEMIQRLRAAARYEGAEVLAARVITSEVALEQSDLASWVKEALTHYWGGPKLTQSPLLGLRVVQQTAQEQEESPTNALRAILRRAIENVRPEGERHFTGEWILYNILEMKFMEGRKVREVAMRLAMSEADLYRKQRVAIEAVANAIVDMEKTARHEIATPAAWNTLPVDRPAPDRGEVISPPSSGGSSISANQLSKNRKRWA